MGAHFCRKDRGSTSLMQKYDVLDVFLMGASCGSTTGQLNFDSNFWRACSIKSDLSSRSFNFFDKGVLLDFEEVQMAKTPKMPCGQAPTKVYQGPYKLLQFPKRFPCPANLLDTWRSPSWFCAQAMSYTSYPMMPGISEGATSVAATSMRESENETEVMSKEMNESQSNLSESREDPSTSSPQKSLATWNHKDMWVSLRFCTIHTMNTNESYEWYTMNLWQILETFHWNHRIHLKETIGRSSVPQHCYFVAKCQSQSE